MLYAWIIFLLTVGSGLIWLADVLLKRRREKRAEGQMATTWRMLADNAKGFFPFLLAIFLIRSFVVEPFHIPSGSMMPSILVGDFVVVEKYAYDLHLPLIHTPIVQTGSIQRGDIIVFHFPEKSALAACRKNPACDNYAALQEVHESAEEDYIKRVVGLPGDTVRYSCSNRLYINGKRVRMKAVGIYRGEGVERLMGGALVYREWLPSGKRGFTEHKVLIMPNQPTVCGRSWHVPPGHYMVMGDNRDDSLDSRYWGFVPKRDIVGKAVVVFFNFQGWTHWPLWGRIGHLLS